MIKKRLIVNIQLQPQDEVLDICIAFASALHCDLQSGEIIDGVVGTHGYVEIEVNDDSRRIKVDSLACFESRAFTFLEIKTAIDFETKTEQLLYKQKLKQMAQYLDLSIVKKRPVSVTPKKFIVTTAHVKDVCAKLPEFPTERRLRYVGYGFELEQAVMFVNQKERGDYLDQALASLPNAEKRIFAAELASWISEDLVIRLQKSHKTFKSCPIEAEDLLLLTKLCTQKKITGTTVKTILSTIFRNPHKRVYDLLNEGDFYAITDKIILQTYIDTLFQESPELKEKVQKSPTYIPQVINRLLAMSKGRVHPGVIECMLKEKMSN